MITIMKRNLKLYFSERSTICYSLLTSLIVLVLYFVFLKQNYIESLKPFREGVKFADIWVLSGILSVTGMTACFHAISQLVVDKSSGRMNAFRLTQTSRFAIYMGCFLSSVIIGIIMQLANLDVDRKSTRLDSSHHSISCAGFCLQKNKKRQPRVCRQRNSRAHDINNQQRLYT